VNKLVSLTWLLWALRSFDTVDHTLLLKNLSLAWASWSTLPYSEALPAQARTKRKILRRLQNELEKSRGRERNLRGRPFQIEGPASEKALFCLVTVQERGIK